MVDVGNINNLLIHRDDVTLVDIIKGRGGHASHRPSHQTYLDHASILRRMYQLASTHQEKRAIQQMLVDFVHQELGGRFLRRVDAMHYIEISHQDALITTAYALRGERIRHRNARRRALQNANHVMEQQQLDVAVNMAQNGHDIDNNNNNQIDDLVHNEAGLVNGRIVVVDAAVETINNAGFDIVRNNEIDNGNNGFDIVGHELSIAVDNGSNAINNQLDIVNDNELGIAVDIEVDIVNNNHELDIDNYHFEIFDNGFGLFDIEFNGMNDM
jgi:hypothetical protein